MQQESFERLEEVNLLGLPLPRLALASDLHIRAVVHLCVAAGLRVRTSAR
jgi:hypothetical protein